MRQKKIELQRFQERYGPWALVTGASTGIGRELAIRIAKLGVSVVLSARSADSLQGLAAKLTSEFGIDCKVAPADLATESGIQAIIHACEDIDIGLLVNNAGREDSGEFLSIPVEDAVATLNLNCKAPLRLSHHFAHRMISRERSGIIFLSSVVAFQGVPLIANYAATKAYDLILAEGLAAELENRRVDVLAVAPGFTRTGLSPEAVFDDLPISPMDPAKVASDAIARLGHRRLTVPGALNRFLFLSGKYLQPRWLNTFAFGRVFRRVLRRKLDVQPDKSSQTSTHSLLPPTEF